ncbi:hypothetical protein [Sulfurisphaera tokodaii]|uniref:Uncharacterized protein n=2 Tax=Sulfurisphaera tokodaii TaxID=111955 RepID=Q972V1_SULTO|nr:hypothetical protein [Sulfurisphaera tokodaii]BAB66062.1 hypothetical protein STK_10350 [Sulfurisphaera tokodaii str. 7]HII74028.1 hypothetical protein [Sulfurisphaera tokodaii]
MVEIIDHTKVIEENLDKLPKPPGEVQILEKRHGSLDEITVGYIKTPYGEGYEIDIDVGNGVHYVVVPHLSKNGLIINVEKFANVLNKGDYLELDMKAIMITNGAKSIIKVLDGRYRIPRLKMTVEELADKMKKEGLSFIKIERIG